MGEPGSSGLSHHQTRPESRVLSDDERDAEALPHSITAVLDRVCEARDGNSTSVGDLVEGLGQLGHSVLVLVPGLLVITPLSGVPGLSSFFGLTIALVSLQMLVGRHHLWLPGWLLKRRIPTSRIEKAVSYLRAPARFIDRHTTVRLGILVHRPFRSILQLACMLCGLAMPFLELVPFSSSILGAAVAFFAIALVAKDGLVALAGLSFLAAVLILVLRLAA